MTTKKIAREKRDWTANWRLLPGLACLALLAGCGGGGSGSDTATAQDATKQIAAAVPGSWTGRVPGSEVINGITVPPIPPSGSSYSGILGVDSNKNGVRDDLERIIAISFSGKKKYQEAFDAAKLAQIAFSDPSKAKENIRAYQCRVISWNDEDRIFFQNAVFNTKERRALYKSTLPEPGTTLTSPDTPYDEGGNIKAVSGGCVSSSKAYYSDN